MGMPYALSFSEPRGFVALSGGYAHVAAGVLLACLLAPLARSASARSRHRLVVISSAVGAALTSILLLLETTRYLRLTAWFEAGPGLAGVATLPAVLAGEGWLGRALLDLASVVSPYEGMVAAVCSTLCGLSIFVGSDAAVAQGGETLRRLGTPRWYEATLSFLLGLTRGVAWVPILPAPPVGGGVAAQAASSDALADVLYWGHASPFGPLFTIVLCAVVLGALAALRREGMSALMVAWCSGELLFRIVARVVPGELEGLVALGGVSTLVHLSLVAALLVACALHRHASCERPRPEGRPQDGASILDAIDSALGNRSRSELASRGLSANEIRAVGASVLGLPAKDAAAALGISPSTLRTYRSRACMKLDVASVEDAAQLARRTDAPSAVARGFALARSCLMAACGALLLLPLGGVSSAWDVTWLPSMGVGLGCLGGFALTAHLPAGGRAAGGRWAGRRIAAALLVSASLVACAWCRVSLLAEGRAPEGWEGRCVTLASYAALSASCAVQLVADARGCEALLGRGAGAVAMRVGPGVAMAAAILVSLTSDAAWRACLVACVAPCVICCFIDALFGAGQRVVGKTDARDWTGGVGSPTLSLASCLLLGVTALGCGELWHGAHYASLAEACVPGAAMMCVACAARCVRGAQPRAGAAHLCSIASETMVGVGSAAVAVLSCAFGLPVLAYTCALFLATLASKTVPGASRRVREALIPVSLGLLCAPHVSNVLWSMHVRPQQGLGQDALIPYVALVAIGVSLVVYTSHRTYVSARVLRDVEGTGGGGECGRLSAALAKCGLSELQRRTLDLTLDGERPDQIARELGYSRRAVDAARRSALDALGLREVDELPVWLSSRGSSL